MPKSKKAASLSAAECALRTGLTVRALRVYERHGLIEPARLGKGWRLYGAKELQRLNVIVTLKTFGMTLAQIRTLLKTKAHRSLVSCRCRFGRAEPGEMKPTRLCSSFKLRSHRSNPVAR